MFEPISTADVSALLSMIEPSWAANAPVVQAIAAIEGGDWWTAPDVADLTGRTPGWCRKLLAKLSEARVVLRRGSGPNGKRFWCEVNPEWQRWQVPWRHPLRVVRQKLADIRERRSIPALQRFIASPMHSRSAEINALLCSRDNAQKEALEAALSRLHGSRDNASGPKPIATPRSRDRGAGYRDSMGVAINPPPASSSSTYSSRSTEPSTTQAPEGPPEDQAPDVDRGELARARTAVLARCLGPNGRRPYLAPKLATQLQRLLAHAGVDEVLAGVEKIETGIHQPYGFLEHLVDVVLAGDQLTLVDVAEDPAVARLRLETKLASVRQQIANYRAIEAEVPDDLLEEEERLATDLTG